MTLLLVIAGITFFAWSAVITLRYRSACLIALAVLLLVLWEFPRTGIVVSVLSIEIHAEDILALLMLVVAAVTHARGVGRLSPPTVLIGGSLLVLLGLGLVTGSVRYGVPAAVNEFRGYFYAIAGYIYVVSMLNAHWRVAATHFRLMAAVGVALSGIAVYHIAMNGLGSSDSWVNIGDEYQTGRPLVAAQAMVLACIGVVFVGRWVNSHARDHAWLGGMFLLIATLCQHRSVWVATVAGISVLLVYSLGRGRTALMWAAILTSYAIVLGIMSGLLGDVLDPIMESLLNTGTYDGRTLSWESLVARNISGGWKTVLLGDAWGAGWERLDDNGNVVQFRPHNTYVSLFLRTGLAGLLVVVFGSLIVAKRLVVRRDEVRLAVLVAIASYCWAYDIDWYVIAVAAWVVYGSRDEPVTAASWDLRGHRKRIEIHHRVAHLTAKGNQ